MAAADCLDAKAATAGEVVGSAGEGQEPRGKALRRRAGGAEIAVVLVVVGEATGEEQRERREMDDAAEGGRHSCTERGLQGVGIAADQKGKDHRNRRAGCVGMNPDRPTAVSGTPIEGQEATASGERRLLGDEYLGVDTAAADDGGAAAIKRLASGGIADLSTTAGR